MQVILLGDLIDVARPGEEVDVTGIYVHASQTISKRSNGFPVFNTGDSHHCSKRCVVMNILQIEVIVLNRSDRGELRAEAPRQQQHNA